MKHFLIVLSSCLLWNAVPAADLLAVYQRALQNDPQLKEAEAIRLAALESKPQALSALLPQLSATGVISRERDTGQDHTTGSVSTGGLGSPTVLETFPFDGRVDTTTHRYGLDLRQNIFRWENWVALK